MDQPDLDKIYILFSKPNSKYSKYIVKLQHSNLENELYFFD